jgi:hypothetical protein
MIFG